MKLLQTSGLAIVVTFSCFSGGCGPSKSDSSPPAMLRLYRRLSGPSAPELVAMTFDMEDADRRRKGIVELSGHSWGLEEPYLKAYATLLKHDTEPCVRSGAARALGKAGPAAEKYVQQLAAALGDKSAMVRCDAAVALDTVIGEEAVGPLRKRAVSDESPDVRRCCAKALRHYRTEAVRETLLRCLKDRAFSVRYQARGSLAALTGRDMGYEPIDWVSVSVIPPGDARSDRPWWNVFNRSGRKGRPATQPAGETEGG